MKRLTQIMVLVALILLPVSVPAAGIIFSGILPTAVATGVIVISGRSIVSNFGVTQVLLGIVAISLSLLSVWVLATRGWNNSRTSRSATSFPERKFIKLFGAVAALGTQVLFLAACGHRRGAPAPARQIISTYSLWDGMGPPNTDPQFAALGCLGTLSISNLDVNFAPGKSPGCSSPMHQRTMGTLGYWEIREIRVTRRPEVLIFRTGTTPPALRVTDWVGSEEFQRVVADLSNAYQARKSRNPEMK